MCKNIASFVSLRSPPTIIFIINSSCSIVIHLLFFLLQYNNQQMPVEDDVPFTNIYQDLASSIPPSRKLAAKKPSKPTLTGKKTMSSNIHSNVGVNPKNWCLLIGRRCSSTSTTCCIPTHLLFSFCD